MCFAFWKKSRIQKQKKDITILKKNKLDLPFRILKDLVCGVDAGRQERTLAGHSRNSLP